MKKGQKSTNESGKRLKELLDEEKMTQVELAELTNYTAQHINNIIKGKRNMSREAAHSFASILEIDEEYLLCETDYKTISEQFKKDVLKDVIVFNQLNKLISLLGYTLKGKQGTPHNSGESCFVIETPSHKTLLCLEKDYHQTMLEITEYIKFKLEFCALQHDHELLQDRIDMVLSPNKKNTKI